MSKIGNQGLKVYNDKNQLCIDSNYSNLELKRVVMFKDLPLRSRDDKFVFRNLTLQSGELLVAREINSLPIHTGDDDWGPLYEAVNLFNYSFASEIGTYCYGARLNYNQTEYAIANPESYANELKLYVFGEIDQKSASVGNEGLKVYDKSGKLIYDSTKKYMRVVGLGKDMLHADTYDLQDKKYAVVESSMNLLDYAYGGFGHDNTWHECEFYCRITESYHGKNNVALMQTNAFLPGNAVNVYTMIPLLSGCFILDVTNY